MLKKLATFRTHENDFGLGIISGKIPHMLIPNVKMSFYSFHIMVVLGTWFWFVCATFYKMIKEN